MNHTKNYTKKTIYGTGIVAVLTLFAAGFSYLLRSILARNLTLSDYGLLYSLISFAGLLTILRDFGMGQAGYYFVPRLIYQEKRRLLKGLISKILKLEILLSLIVSFVLIILSDFLIANYFGSASHIVMVFFAISFFFGSIETNIQHFFNMFQNTFLFSLHNLARNIIFLVVSVVLLSIMHDVTAPVMAYAFTNAILLISFGTVFFKRIFPDFFALKTQNFKLTKLVYYGIPATLSIFGFLIASYVDTLLLTYFRTLEEVGLYNAVIPVVSLLLFLPQAVSTVVTPLSSELWVRKKLDTLKLAVESITKYLVIFLIPVATVFLIYPQITLNLLFGDKFVSATHALVILTVGGIFYGITTLNIQFLIGISGPKQIKYVALSTAFLSIFLNLLLIPRYGIIGAAIGTSVSQLISFFISSLTLYRKVAIKFEWQRYIMILADGAVFLLLVSYLKSVINLSLLLEPLIVIGISGLTYIVLLFLFRIVTLEEIKDVKSKLFS